MKITAVRPWIIEVPWSHRPGATGDAPRRLRQFLFVQVDTDEGVTGWGEVTTYPGATANRAVASMIREAGKALVGRDPSHIEAIWNETLRSYTYVGTRGATSAMVSAIDIALWDIRGKVLGQPIYMLLGGPVRDRIALYTHPPEAQDPKSAVQDVIEIKNSGHMALKFDPFMRSIPEGNAAYMDGQISRRGMDEGIEIVAAIRDAVGPEIELLIDAHGKYNVPTAVDLARMLEPYNIFWFEEPCPPESYHALRQVREQINLKISVGERLHTRFEFIPILENELTDFIMPDVTWTGGISELKKVSTLAESYYVPVSPHDAGGPINVIAGAQVMLTVPNFYKLETHRYDLSGYDPFIDHGLDVREGCLHVSNRPGLGINLNLDYMKAHALEGFAGEV